MAGVLRHLKVSPDRECLGTSPCPRTATVLGQAEVSLDRRVSCDTPPVAGRGLSWDRPPCLGTVKIAKLLNWALGVLPLRFSISLHRKSYAGWTLPPSGQTRQLSLRKPRNSRNLNMDHSKICP